MVKPIIIKNNSNTLGRINIIIIIIKIFYYEI
jgi:hypothetical protein